MLLYFFLLSSYSENIPRPYNVPLVVRHVSLVHIGIICSHLPFLSLSLYVCLLPFWFFNFIQTCASFPVSFFTHRRFTVPLHLFPSFSSSFPSLLYRSPLPCSSLPATFNIPYFSSNCSEHMHEH